MAARSVFTALGMGAVAILALAACTATPAVEGSPTSPPASGDVVDADVDATWLDDGRMMGIITYGSSTCVPVFEDSGMQDNGTFAVILADPETDEVCAADYVPRVTLIESLAGMDPAEDLEITVAGDGFTGDTELDGIEGLDPSNTASEYAPSAGWIDEDAFVILTWGSSTCAPVVASTAVTGAAEVTVTFVDPPADQVCTMDMTPRALVTSVTGLDDDESVTAVLTGDDVDGARVPIYGSN